eukprot:TRINITY_DN12077_c0_g1_i1.p1 TRINITY_DN12077_c0_g1~~TRINITY_DN12077_c0_g1_i1.p1  ORF type:complete len:151 (+),score=28.52 TRINITY_DN12077_c0_g1_i1:140-592(+)
MTFPASAARLRVRVCRAVCRPAIAPRCSAVARVSGASRKMKLRGAVACARGRQGAILRPMTCASGFGSLAADRVTDFQWPDAVTLCVVASGRSGRRIRVLQAGQTVVKPPSTVITAPLTKLAASEPRKLTSSATSAGGPQRGIGTIGGII